MKTGGHEGSWLGPDKVAHILIPPAITGWAAAYAPGWPAAAAWIGSVIACGVWELSNQWYVFSGKKGISIKDFMAFLAGGFIAGALLWGAP